MKHLLFILPTLCFIACNSTFKNEQPVKDTAVITKHADLEKDSSDIFFDQVVQKKMIGKEFSFEQPDYISKLIYLGQLTSKSGETYHLLNNTFFFNINMSPRASCKIFVYDKSNKCMGYYYIGGAYDLPLRIKKNQLVFKPGNDCNQTTMINFNDGLPAEIFVACTKGGGDFFTFQKN